MIVFRVGIKATALAALMVLPRAGLAADTVDALVQHYMKAHDVPGRIFTADLLLLWLWINVIVSLISAARASASRCPIGAGRQGPEQRRSDP
jgi:hypothetical protein